MMQITNSKSSLSIPVPLSLLRPQERVDGGVEAGEEDAAPHLELAGHLARQTLEPVPLLPEIGKLDFYIFFYSSLYMKKVIFLK